MGLVAKTGETLNIRDAYKDTRFVKDIDPTTGTVVRSCLVSPIMDKDGVIGELKQNILTDAYLHIFPDRYEWQTV